MIRSKCWGLPCTWPRIFNRGRRGPRISTATSPSGHRHIELHTPVRDKPKPIDGYGDCEDYVLLKRRMLMQSGWPREALLVTAVRDEKDEGHAVLTVITDKGDYILDNQNKNILLWSETRYRFIKRQSQADPNVWVSLSNQQPAIATATSR